MATIRITVASIADIPAAREEAEALMEEGDELTIEVVPVAVAPAFQERKPPIGAGPLPRTANQPAYVAEEA